MKKFPWWVLVIPIVPLYFCWGLSCGNIVLDRMGYSALDAKTIVEILQSFVEVGAIVIAGIWTYNRFIKSREDYPYPKIEQRCEHYVLEHNAIYLSVFVTVSNQGKTKLDLDGAIVIVRQVYPLSKKVKGLLVESLRDSGEIKVRSGDAQDLFIDQGQHLRWDTLGQRQWKESRGKINELEPGQTREYQFDFLLLEDDVKVIEVISSFDNGVTAWEVGTLYSLSEIKT